jgi:phosphoserine phosphatase RsbU/P
MMALLITELAAKFRGVERVAVASDPLARLCLDGLSRDEQHALERDLELASQVQRALLPRTDVRFGDWRIHYQYKPAGIVSGDYCDLIAPARKDGRLTSEDGGPANEDSGLVFLLGDASGKGVAASLLMTHLHATFRSLAGLDLALGTQLEIANRLFCESTIASQYATLICGRISEDGIVELGSAGHLPALLVSKSGVKKIGATGFPLGIFPTSRYAVHRFQLEPGDTLVLFTDGISEARDVAGDEYGIDGVALTAGARHGWSSRELVSACREDVDWYSRGTRQADDQTILAIHLAEASAVTFDGIAALQSVRLRLEGN